MKISIKKFIFILLIILFVNCNDTTHKPNNNIKEKSSKLGKLYKKKEIEIDIDAGDFFTSRNTYVKDELYTTYLLRTFHKYYHIERWNWTNKKRMTNITFTDYGPNAVKSVVAGSFYPITKDSFLLPSVFGRIYLQTPHTTKLLYSNNNNKNLLLGSRTESKIIRINDNFYIRNAFYFDQPAQDNLWENYNPLICYNITENNIKPTKIYYPDVFYEKCWTFMQTNFSFTKFGHKIAFTFGGLNKIFVYDTKANKIKKEIKFKSNFFKHSLKPIDCDIINTSERAFKIKSQHNIFAIEYDKFRDVFYLIILLPPDDVQDILGPEKWDVIMPFSILVLDSNFNTIDEIKLPGKQYFFREFFVTKEGLWISNNNELNPSIKEDKLKYTLFCINEVQ